MPADGSAAAIQEAEATQESETYIAALEAEIARLKSNQSFGYVRGRGLALPTSGSIVPAKPMIEPLDVSETQAPHG
jgi:hypothetical protein